MSKNNPKTSGKDFATRVATNVLAFGGLGTLLAGGGRQVGEHANNFIGDFAQPYFDYLTAHPNSAPILGASIGTGIGIANAVASQRRDYKAEKAAQQINPNLNTKQNWLGKNKR